MSRDENSPRRSSDNNKQASGPPLIWLIVIAMLVMAIAGVLVFNNANQRIDYPDLVSLIKASHRTELRGKLAPGATGSVDVEVLVAGKKQIRRYSNMRNVIMGDRSVIGLVDREVFDVRPPEKSTAKGEGESKQTIEQNVEREPITRDVKFETKR